VWLRFFEIVVTGDDVARPKPDSEGIAVAVRVIQASPQNGICIGDSLMDIQASRSYGIRSGAALLGSHSVDEVKASNPDFIFNRPLEVIETLIPS
jgi:phosphoglycolate phosphatase/pyrophosphatase PpaX